MRYLPVAAAVVAVSALVACGGSKRADSGALASAGGSAYKAMSLTDGEIATMSDQSCTAMDRKNHIAPPGSRYAARLNQVIRRMPASVNGRTANYKVYMTKDVNAWAMANGCIRVYSGLMDLMNDDELRGVIGHEIGHVALGHSKSRMQTAYAASAVRELAGASGGVAARLSQSEAGDLGEKFINAQFSQANESAADNYSFDLLTERRLERRGLVSAFDKLARLDGGGSGSSLLSSHPPSADRSSRMQSRLDASR
ncbi:putative metalloprotease [Variovorax sp. OAS795]|uniref:M48 family metalloprotease n=1 Tax=Variovorax sp. OAS795 TaxID=3034231 RepID=UPI003393589F